MIPHMPALPVSSEMHGDDEFITSSGPTFGLVDVRIVWPVGATSDGEIAGLSAIAWEMLERGTTRRSRGDFHAAMERLGATASFRMLRQSAQFALRVLDAHLEEALELVAEAMLEPLDDPLEFSELLEESDEAVAISLESPEGGVSRWLSRASWSEAPWSLPVDGTAETRAAIRLEALAPRRARILATPAIFGIACENPSVVMPAVLRLRERLRGSLSVDRLTAPSMPARRWGLAHLLPVTAEQGALTVVSDGPHPTDSDWPAVALHSTLFGDGFTSPLVGGMRARDGLSYDVSWSLYPERGGSAQVFRCHPEAGRIIEALDVADTIWAEASARLPSDEALDRAKASYVGARLVSLETAERRLASACVLRLLGLPLSRLWELPRRVTEVSAAAVAASAERYAWGTGRRLIVAALADANAWPDRLGPFESIDLDLVR